MVQIFKQPMPDGRLATAMRCTDESSMRMDPREVAAQMMRLCAALASGVLSLDGLGALMSSRGLPLSHSVILATNLPHGCSGGRPLVCSA